MGIDLAALDETLANARGLLLSARLASGRRPARIGGGNPGGRRLLRRFGGGHWEGELSSSALSTATAVTALTLVDRTRHEALIRRGLAWLARHRNADGGWGDTVLSKSNISTTALAWAAFGAAGQWADGHREAVAGAEAWLGRAAGGLDPARLAAAIDARYGSDRTFSAPILTMCALCGRLGEGAAAWSRVKPLPFELAALPHRLFKWLRLPVVSYALPALIAIGQARFVHAPPRNPLAWLVRRLIRRPTLARLVRMQPESGGFLEATPITSFVAMSLASIGERGHPVAAKAVEFLLASARDDGSWPIDTNLATWVTTLSVNALSPDPRFADLLPAGERARLLDWLLGQQHLVEHPYTHAEPGGWAWTDLSGGVPDADDTAGALRALRALAPADPRVRQAAARGIAWLLGLQNRDGGIPTFCRGWGALPFDRSADDLTAHALLALNAWLGGRIAGSPPPDLARRAERAIRRGLRFLAATQRSNGSWTPLWFGNQDEPNDENPTYGTARVLIALADLAGRHPEAAGPMLRRGVEWLLAAQNTDGGWGGAPSTPSSIEETALAVDALCRVAAKGGDEWMNGRVDEGQSHRSAIRNPQSAIAAGVAWLIEHTDRGRAMPPAPIGFYFAKLWYFERLYPLIFTVSALEQARRSGLEVKRDSC